MNLGYTTPEQYARAVQLLGPNNEVFEFGVAELLRAPLSRWGVSPKRAVLKHAREQVEAAGLVGQFPADRVASVLDRLVSLEECQEVVVGQEPYIAPASPRWLKTGADGAVLLGAIRLPDGIEIETPAESRDIVRRFGLTPGVEAALRLAGVAQIDLDQWLRPLQYLQHAARRKGSLARHDKGSLSGFWSLLTEALGKEGQPIGRDAKLRVLTGPPGTYFGQHRSAECEGRWTEDGEDGVWCAYRWGYSDGHWHPILLDINGEERRCLDLFDEDEWRWALLARGFALDSHEVIRREDGRVDLTFRAPRQLEAAMDLVGKRTAAWKWATAPGAPDPWAIIELHQTLV